MLTHATPAAWLRVRAPGKDFLTCNVWKVDHGKDFRAAATMLVANCDVHTQTVIANLQILFKCAGHSLTRCQADEFTKSV